MPTTVYVRHGALTSSECELWWQNWHFFAMLCVPFWWIWLVLLLVPPCSIVVTHSKSLHAVKDEMRITISVGHCAVPSQQEGHEWQTASWAYDRHQIYHAFPASRCLLLDSE